MTYSFDTKFWKELKKVQDHNRRLRGKEVCEWCGEAFDSKSRVEIDCGRVIDVFDHGTYLCPDKEDRIPYVHPFPAS